MLKDWLLRIVFPVIFLISLAGLAYAGQPVPIPAGELSASVGVFSASKTYPVYSAPDENSLRGAGGKAAVNTSDWVQVFGRDGDWLLIQYGISSGKYRIGYIRIDDAAPQDAVQIDFANVQLKLATEAVLTDDPLGRQSKLCTLASGAKITLLSSLGSEWAYIAAETSGKTVRGFVQSWIVAGAKAVSEESRQADLEPAQDENGKWGYVDSSGQFVIPAQYDAAGSFRGSYAVVSLNNVENADYWYCGGIIDTSGQWVVPPEYGTDEGYDGGWYGGYDHGIIALSAADDRYFWFCLDTGYFSGSSSTYGELSNYWKYNSVVAMVTDPDSDEYFLVRLDNGERIPCELLEQEVPEGTYIFAENPCDIFFCDGYLCFRYLDEETGNTSDAWFLDECGHAVRPDPDYTIEDTECGCGLISARSNRTGLYGYLSMRDGKAAIKAEYEYAGAFSRDGYAEVTLQNGEEWIIDTDGNKIERILD